MIRAGNDLKAQESKIYEELSPLAEIVNVACLRLPNSLHYSTLLLDTISSLAAATVHVEDRFRHVLFDMNTPSLTHIKKKMRDKFDGHDFDWRELLADTVEMERGVRISSSDARPHKWSFVKESSIESIPNNRYLVGTYARIEQALVDFVHAKIDSLNDHSPDPTRLRLPNFEHIKSVSMFKSSVVEGNICLFRYIRINGIRSSHINSSNILRL